jgi:hypothetical protein
MTTRLINLALAAAAIILIAWATYAFVTVRRIETSQAIPAWQASPLEES